MAIFASLGRQQKEAIGLLQIGSFLEYFDLLLYVHMAVLLNELFFPKTDPHTAALLAAFAFCSTYVLRPFGALLFGWIGDNMGRKSTVIITSMMMALSCLVMAILPTYEQIGILSAWIVTVCRVVQGLSSMGEIIGAEIYVTEITKPPVQYVAVSLIDLAAYVGGAFAVGVAALVTIKGFDWRDAFWIGACIAVVGSVARTRLRETPEFLQKKLKATFNKKEATKSKSFKMFLSQEKVGKKVMIAFFATYCGWPLSFYLIFMYFNPFLKSMGKSAQDIIMHNFFLSIVLCVAFLCWGLLSYKVHPLKISKLKGIGFLAFSLLLPAWLFHVKTSADLFFTQTILIIFALSALPSNSIFIRHFPILKRFTVTSFLYALTRALMYIFTSFGLVYFTEWLGHWGTWLITLPVGISFYWGVCYFEKLERKAEEADTKVMSQKFHQVS